MSMKKTYKSPYVGVVTVECEFMIANSPGGNIGIDKGEGGTDQLSNRQQGKWGDVWGK